MIPLIIGVLIMIALVPATVVAVRKYDEVAAKSTPKPSVVAVAPQLPAPIKFEEVLTFDPYSDGSHILDFNPRDCTQAGIKRAKDEQESSNTLQRRLGMGSAGESYRGGDRTNYEPFASNPGAGTVWINHM